MSITRRDLGAVGVGAAATFATPVIAAPVPAPQSLPYKEVHGYDVTGLDEEMLLRKLENLYAQRARAMDAASYSFGALDKIEADIRFVRAKLHALNWERHSVHMG